ncbi:UDP-N-acetylglucosamine 2-epimerase [Dehalococcoidia bacterium]|nr:UDP-N-acetylglucosamine 2-epimerase [Dehalococcoidia bacterium]
MLTTRIKAIPDVIKDKETGFIMKNNYRNRSKPKALFIVSSTAQIEMFTPIIKELTNWDTMFINTDKWNHREDMEKIMQEMDIAYKTIAGLNINSVKNTLTREQPNIVIVGHDQNLMDKLFIKCAHSMDIPTLLIQDGVLAASMTEVKKGGNIGNSLKYWITFLYRAFRFIMNREHSWHRKIETGLLEVRYGTRGKPVVYGHGESSRIAVFGDAVKKRFISEGVAPERIIVTGNPKFDMVFHAKNNNCKQNICEKMNIPPDKKIVLLLTSYFVEAGMWTSLQRKEFVMSIAEAISELPNTQLIIKLHPPYEKEEDYQEIVKGLSDPPIICKYTSISELIGSCDLAITVISTTALEAMAMGKPVLIVDLFDDLANSIYKCDDIVHINQKADILPVMRDALYDIQTKSRMTESMKNFIYEQAYIQDGKASKRIVQLIEDMCAKNNLYKT